MDWEDSSNNNFPSIPKVRNSAIAAPSLIVVPLSVINAWCQEFQRWCPSMCVIKFHSSSKGEKERLKEKLRADPLKFDAVITTYEMLNSSGVGNIFLGHNIIWKYVVIDEGHKIKNEHSEISKTVSKIKSLGKVLLTGTLYRIICMNYGAVNVKTTFL